MKVCSRCSTEKALDEFHRSNRCLDGRQPVCKGCKRGYNLSRYAEDKDRVLARNERYRREYLEWLDELKAGPCVDCGQALPACAKQWDHIPGAEKLFAIGEIRNRLYAKPLVLAEIAKCELVCATCHSVRTWARRAPEAFWAWAGSRPSIPAGWIAAATASLEPPASRRSEDSHANED